MQLFGREIGLGQPFFLIAGPCVVENEELQLRTAEKLKRIADRLGIMFIFKSSYDKANRSSDKSFRGLGMDEGLRILAKVREELNVPVLTDRCRKRSTFSRLRPSSPARPISSTPSRLRASR